MALPIAPTPQFTEDEWERFHDRIEEGLKHPTHRRDVSEKLKKALELIKAHAILESEQNRN
ncbi:MAG: hypothetical protein HQK60_17135 [Deltaproteobacteria bacterium]|nr:hypothetical protein [Deltaproteobacteria bacterium]